MNQMNLSSPSRSVATAVPTFRARCNFQEELMKKLFMTMLFAALGLSVAVSNAEAKRLGSGSSFGKQSQGVSRQAPTQSSPAANAAKPATPAATPAAVPPKPASPWKGILGGALLGLGLGALLSHFGLGGALASMISTLLMVALLVGAAYFIYRMWRRNTDGNKSQAAFAGGIPNATPEISSRIEPTQLAAWQSPPQSGASDVVNAPWGLPADFDVPAFLRQAKTYFIRLQAAWDKAEINDIREFTTPEMFAELRLQIQERGATANHTDVVQLDAELLGMETVGVEYLVSVKFGGQIKESAQAPAEPFSEVWNLSKPTDGTGGWVLAGIQQLS
jgi:predicted lipid-binding transport protein (Tim44 family)